MGTAERVSAAVASTSSSGPSRAGSTVRPRGCPRWRPVALTIFLLFATGCTSWREYVANGFKVGPNYCRPEAPVADRWIDAAEPGVSGDPANDAAWWQTFHDPVLDSLVQVAYRQNLTLRIAGLRVLEARAQRGIAVGELFPQTQNAFGDYTRSGSSNTTATVFPARFFDEWTTGANLAWELDFWGRFRRAIEAADANLDVSIENYDEVLVLLLSEVAQSYVDLRTSEQRLAYAARNVVIQAGSLNLAELKYDDGRGIVSRLDVTQAQSNLSQTQGAIPPLEAARRQAANQLCILLGMPPGSLDERLQDPQVGKAMEDMQATLEKPDMKAIQAIQEKKVEKIIPTAPAQVAVGIPADLLRRRPDIRSAERRAAEQSAQIGVATSDLYPHFSITGSIFFDANHFKDLFNGGSLAGNVGPSFRWDVLNYGRLINNIRVQDARFQQLAVQYQETVLRANAEAEDALVAFLKAQQQVIYLQQSVVASRDSLGLVQQQYDAGKTDFNRVFNIQQLLTQQEDQLAVAEGTVAGGLVQLYKALGGGWQIRLAGSESPPVAAAAETGEPAPEEPPPAPEKPATAPKEPAPAPKEPAPAPKAPAPELKAPSLPPMPKP
jgi:outer membrane protein TolC